MQWKRLIRGLDAKRPLKLLVAEVGRILVWNTFFSERLVGYGEREFSFR
jgi:hypothetical protein